MRWVTGRNRYWHVASYPVLICDLPEPAPPAAAWRVFRDSIRVRHCDFDCYALAVRPYPGHPIGFVTPGTRLVYPDGNPSAASLDKALWLTYSPEEALLDALDLTQVEVHVYRLWFDADETVVRLHRMPEDAGLDVFEDDELWGEPDPEMMDLGPEPASGM